MFPVFADQARTANIYTHEFNIASCMLQKGCYSAKVYTLEIYTCYIYSRCPAVTNVDFGTTYRFIIFSILHAVLSTTGCSRGARKNDH